MFWRSTANRKPGHMLGSGAVTAQGIPHITVELVNIEFQ